MLIRKTQYYAVDLRDRFILKKGKIYSLSQIERGDIYYNLQLGSGCNLGKDLSKKQRNYQFVKCKDTEQYL